MDYEKDVHMVHFSGKLKPSHWMFDTASPRPTYEEFVNTTMVDQFLTVMERGKASKDKARIEEHIREITRISCSEWYDHYDQLVTKQSWIADVVKRIRDTLVANAARPTPTSFDIVSLLTVGAYVLPTVEVFEGRQLDGCWRCAGCTAPGVQVGVLHPIGPCLGVIDGGQSIGFNRTDGVQFYLQGSDVDGRAGFGTGFGFFFQVACSFPRGWRWTERSSIPVPGGPAVAAEVSLFPASVTLSFALGSTRGRVVSGAGSSSYCDLFAVSAFEPQHFSVLGYYLFFAVNLLVVVSLDVVQHGGWSCRSQMLQRL